MLQDGKPRLDVIRDNLEDTVVWNPWMEGAKPGLGVQEFRNMIAIGCGKVTEKFALSTDLRYTVVHEVKVSKRSA